eukprot:scaffold998_cov213-Chaetoceros_neogracile.AAC.2
MALVSAQKWENTMFMLGLPCAQDLPLQVKAASLYFMLNAELTMSLPRTNTISLLLLLLQ